MENLTMNGLALLIIVGSLYILFKIAKAIAFRHAKQLQQRWREYEREERRKQSPWR